MRNFVQLGDVLDMIAPSPGVVGGKGYLIGGIFGVATGTAATGDTFALAVEGVFALDALVTDVITAGGPVYWDATNLRCTSTATGNLFIGAATVAKANGDLTVNVYLYERVLALAANIAPVVTTAATNTTPYGYSQAQANAIVTQLNLVIAALAGAGITTP